MLFDGAPLELPTATLRPRGSGAWLVARASELQHWFWLRWAWLRPRMLPMTVAAAGFVIAVVAARYTGTHSRHGSLALRMHANVTSFPHLQPWTDDVGPRCQGLARPGTPDRLVIKPLRHGEPYIELTIDDADHH